MTASREFCEHVVDQLRRFGPVSIRRMFGGAGVFRDGLMFGLIADDMLYLKADDRTRPDFERAGMGPFTYEAKNETMSLSYFEVPPEAMEDADMLCDWARAAFDVALRAQAAKQRPAKEKARARAKPKIKAKRGTTAR